MNFDVLRQKILEKAIRGELVPQLESEPKVKQIGEAPEDVPFAIPEKWKWVSASYVQTLVRGVTFPASAKAKTQTSNSICCLTTGSVQEKYANKADVFVDQSFMKNTRQILQVGDVVISSANSKELVGKSILWEDNSGMQKTFGGFLTVARVKDSQSVIPEYLFLVYRYMFKTGYFANLSTQTTNIANLSNKLLDSLAFPIAPLAEQKRIATQINQLFEQIDCAEKAYKELSGPLSERFRQLCLEKAIQGKLVPQLESEPEVRQLGEVPENVPFAIPEKWKWVKLENLGKWKSGGTPSRSHREYYENGTIPWLKTGDLNDGVIKSVGEYITNAGLENSSAHINPAGSVLIAMYGATIGKVGILQFPCATNQACCACVLKENICDQWYLFYFLLSQRKNFIALGAGGAQPNISRTKIVNSWIPLPPLEEQHRIVAKLNELIGFISQLAQTISTP